jgi:hypothetical protein
MIIALLAVALIQLTPQQQAAQKASEDQAQQWIKDHQAELRQRVDRSKQVSALSYDQALIVYDQCLARSAAALDNIPPDALFGRALQMCLPLRAELLNGRPPAWFVGFSNLDAAKRASFPALARQVRER